jgi:hypothetical protein
MSSPAAAADAFMSQKPMFSRRRGGAAPVKKKKKGKKVGGGASPRASDEAPSSSRSFVEFSMYDLDADALRDEVLARDLEIAALRGQLKEEEARSDKMEKTAEIALRALDSHLADEKWSTIVSPPVGSRSGATFQWSDAQRGIVAKGSL